MSKFFARLIERRVPQYMLVYIGAAWGILEFTQFIVGEYLLSPHWTRIVFYAVLMLWPGYLLVVYRHARPGTDPWGRIEKIGVPLNLALAFVALFLMFRGEDLGAQTTVVTLADESGDMVEREVAKQEFRKRIVFFDFDSVGLADDDLWLTGFVPLAVHIDILGDDFFDPIPPSLLIERLRRTGSTTLRDVPLALKREIADEFHAGWILSGSIGRSAEGYAATAMLHRVGDGKLVAEESHAASELFDVVDLVSADLRRLLEVPERDMVPDLPVEEYFSSDAGAVEAFGKAMRVRLLENDWDSAIELMRQAVAADPTFAIAQHTLAAALLLNNRGAEAVIPIQAALANVYRLPERTQFIVKSDYYFLTQDIERADGVIEMWAELYPDDLIALQNLLAVQTARSQRVEAIATLEKIYAINSGMADVLKQIARLHTDLGNFDEARAALERYLELYPDDFTGLQGLAGVELSMGDLDAARRTLDRALLLEPTNTELLVTSARLHQRVGDFDKAGEGLRAALAGAPTAAARVNVLGALQTYYFVQGQTSAALDTLAQFLDEAPAVALPVQVIALHVTNIDIHLQTGREAEVRAILDQYGPQLPVPATAVAAIAEARLAIELGDAVTAGSRLDEAEAIINANQVEPLRGQLLSVSAELEALEGNWADALRLREEFLRANPTDLFVHASLAECLRQLGRLDEAEQAIRRMIEGLPGSASAYVELARILEARGDRAGALGALDRALGFWSRAEPDYEPAAEARALRDALATA